MVRKRKQHALASHNSILEYRIEERWWLMITIVNHLYIYVMRSHCVAWRERRTLIYYHDYYFHVWFSFYWSIYFSVEFYVKIPSIFSFWACHIIIYWINAAHKVNCSLHIYTWICVHGLRARSCVSVCVARIFIFSWISI